jgi:hypothetical protein
MTTSAAAASGRAVARPLGKEREAMNQMIIDRQGNCATLPGFRLRAVTRSDQVPMNTGLVRRDDPRWRAILAPPGQFEDEVFASGPRRSRRPFAAACCGLLVVAGAYHLASHGENAERVLAGSEIQAALDARDARAADVRVPISSLLFELSPAWSAFHADPDATPVEAAASTPRAPAPAASQPSAPLELHPNLAPLPPRRPASLDAIASTPPPPRNTPRSIDLAWATR